MKKEGKIAGLKSIAMMNFLIKSRYIAKKNK